jgi:hypothetical protein
MNRKAYASVLALIFLALVLWTGCSSSHSAPPVESIAATSGSGQSAVVNTAFSAPLVATVTTGGSPTSGATVTFTAPSSGASGTFANGTTTDTETTNASGVATSTAFTANGTAGAYTVTATVTGVSTPANFNLTNTAGPAASIAATSGTPQSAAINTAFAAPLAATVQDSGQNPVSGVVVTFTAPTTGASGTFANGTNTDTETTNASGVATSTTFTANGTVGGPYTVTSTVAGVATPANFSLTNTLVTTSNYSFYLTGMEAINSGPLFYALAGSVTIDSNGNVLAGEQDYNDALGLTSPQPSGDAITGGTLTVDGTTGQGTLTLITNNAALGVNGTETLGVQFANTKHALIVQFDGTATSSGSMDLQTLPSTLSGGYAFALSGVDPSYLPVVAGGIFSISGTNLQNGIYDFDDAGSVTLATPFSGTISAPDTFGRGTITGTGIAVTFNYYIVSSKVIRIIDVDISDSVVGSAFSQGAGTFSNASLGSSVFGVESNSFGFIYAAAGMFTTVPGSGTFQGFADDDEFGFVSSGSISGTYSIGSNGYGGLTITNGGSQDVSALGIYMTDPNLNLNDPNNTTSGLGGAVVADLDVTLNGTGVLTPQTDTSTASFAGNYAFGAQDFFGCGVGLGTCEFDYVGQGSVTSGVLTGTGLLSDPFFGFGASATNSGATFSGTAAPDGSNVGRYTMIPFDIAAVAGSPFGFTVVIYQASGEQLFWLDEDNFSLSLGALEQQGSLTGLPAARGAAAKTKAKRKP